MTAEQALEITMGDIVKTEHRLERAYRQHSPQRDIANIKKRLEYQKCIQDFLMELCDLARI